MPVKNLDSFFTIAKQHVICEDYTLVGSHPIPHLILCDGCSTSNHSDVGARILAICAQKALKDFVNASAAIFPSYAEFGQRIILNAQQAVELLGLEMSCLDATLMLALLFRESVSVYVYGDGYLATQNTTGELHYVNISYAKNMPYYLTYWLDDKRRSLYSDEHGDGQGVVTLTEFDNHQERLHTMAYDAPLIFTFASSDLRLLALMSDGVSSFLAIESNQKIPVREVIEGLVAYKTTKGNFVQRRAKRMLKNYHKQEIYPTDDVSVATMLL